MSHVMVDVETLGVKPGAVILSIGAVEFSEDGTGREFYRPIDVFTSLMAGLTIDPGTLDWWRSQPPEVHGPLHGGRSLRVVLDAFSQWLTAGEEWFLWAKGPDFDLVLLEAAYDAVGRRKPWHYRHARDVRTVLALVPCERPERKDVKHHALDDARAQAVEIIAACKTARLRLA